MASGAAGSRRKLLGYRHGVPYGVRMPLVLARHGAACNVGRGSHCERKLRIHGQDSDLSGRLVMVARPLTPVRATLVLGGLRTGRASAVVRTN